MAASPKKITMIDTTSEPYFSWTERRRFSNEPVIEDMGIPRVDDFSPGFCKISPGKCWRPETAVTLLGASENARSRSETVASARKCSV